VAQGVSFEQTVGKQLYKPQGDRSAMGKLLSEDEILKLESLIKKEKLTRIDLLEILYRLTTQELKLANLTAHERYILGKFFVWIRELVKTDELLYDYMDKLTPKAGQVITTAGTVEVVEGDAEDKDELNFILDSINLMLQHNIKFAVDVYLYILRSSLGMGKAFTDLSTNKFEYAYPQFGQQPQQIQPQQVSGGIFGGKK
jgi:hypothetical protein